jgi:mRNA-degrading endonuclease RelE of RelBE toxin-antitoxin system
VGDLILQRSAQKELDRLKKRDPQAHTRIQDLLGEVPAGGGKVLNNEASGLNGCRSLRSGKLRVVYRPGPEPEVLYVGYRRDVYHGICDN